MSNAEELRKEIDELKAELERKQNLLKSIEQRNNVQHTNLNGLTNEEISRYSRQIILPQVGVKGQLALKGASVLIVGAGGLGTISKISCLVVIINQIFIFSGCPSAQYLCGAGIGHIGIVDYDIVEINNIHRQILHTEHSLGQSKVVSAKAALQKLNSNLKVSTHQILLNSENALDVIKKYDVVLDATDNVATRYLLNDACVLLKKPLVSGSALQLEGQLTVYSYLNGPCYRCLFPIPPLASTVSNCGDAGVIGAITGIIGALQALEAIKIILNLPNCLNGRLLLFDGSATTFRSIKLRNKRDDCDVCSKNPKITKLIDYEQFCGMQASDKDMKLNILPASKRIGVIEYQEIMAQDLKHLLLDVRSVHEFEICQLQKSMNVPIKKFTNDKQYKEQLIENILEEKLPVYVVCRRGNDSQVVAQALIDEFNARSIDTEVKDIVGGLHAWTALIDSNFPIY